MSDLAAPAAQVPPAAPAKRPLLKMLASGTALVLPGPLLALGAVSLGLIRVLGIA